MAYASPVDGSALLEVKNADGETVYRDKATGVEYTKEYLDEQKVEQVKGTDGASDSSSDAREEDPNADLKGLKRGELDEVARNEGLNPEDYSNADEVRQAIVDGRANQ